MLLLGTLGVPRLGGKNHEMFRIVSGGIRPMRRLGFWSDGIGNP